MNREQMLQLREEFDSTDQSDSIERAELETDVDPDPMVGTSLRLPKSLLDWVRAEAKARHVKPTAFIRQCLEQRRAVGATELEQRVEHLEHVVHVLTESAGIPPQRQPDSYNPTRAER